MTRQKRYYLLTLGCPKNTVDSEGMASLLSAAGYRGTGAPEDADVLIVNTCGFLAAAEDESIEILRELALSKHENQLLIAAGCMAQRAGERIVQDVPQVDGLLGTRRWMEIVPLIRAMRVEHGPRAFGRYELIGDPDTPLRGPMLRPAASGGSAYLKISDGCNAPCAFCSIPTIKGRLRSRPLDALITEAGGLVASGAKELIVIGQDTTDYGRDLGQKDGLPALLQAILDSVPALKWLRLMYAYPGHVSNTLIDLMARDSRMCHYLDIPLQHGHPDVLRRMRRPADSERQIEMLAHMRSAMPDMAIRSTFIVGFPGETEEEFSTLLAFMREVQFDKVGVFPFSAEPGTAAASLPNQVDEEVKTERFHRAMSAQQRISLLVNQRQVGRVLDVLVEGHGEAPEKTEPVTLGRSYRDAPEVDGVVMVPGIHTIGDMLRVCITGAMEYDLVGEPSRAEPITLR